MADDSREDFPSKRIRLSPERETDGLSPHKAPKTDKEGPLVDEEPFLINLSAFQETPSSREQDGGNNEIQKHDQLESDDFPSCFSVEDDIDNSEEHHYQPIAGPMGWVQRQMTLGINPREILSYMVPHAKVPTDLEDDHSTLWKIIIGLLTSPSPRQKLDYVNTIEDVVNLINSCKNIVVLTGAGVSVSCGIPDFRSRDGIYARLSEEYPDLPDPQAMFDISYFNQNPRPFFKFAKEIYPGQFKPSLCHKFIHLIEAHGRLLRNYSQNIDTLEQIAGITRVIQCHGSFSTASCTNCKYQVSSSAIKDDVFSQRIPVCPKCNQEGLFAIMKPDIVFFGENLPSDFYHHLEEDSEKADLLIVIGSSLKVRPVALIPSRIAEDVPQILINREPLRHMTFDVELLGDCDVIVSELCKRLGEKWTSILDGTEVPVVSRDLYSGLIDSTSNEIPSQNVDGKENITLEPHENNQTHDSTPQHSSSFRDPLDHHHQPLSVPLLNELNQTSINMKQQELYQDETVLHSDEAPLDSYLLNGSGTTPSAIPQTLLDHNKESTQCSPCLDNKQLDSLPTNKDAVASSSKNQGIQEEASGKPVHETVTSGAETKQPVVDGKSLGEDTSGLLSSSSINDTYKQGQDSLSGDIITGCQYTSSQDPSDSDSPTFIYLPPSRYIFYGAEISNSPIHSPFGSPIHDDNDDDDTDSENCYNSDQGNMPKDGLELSLLDSNGYSSSGDGSEGYGSGVMSATELSNYDLKLITGALGEYSCVSEENSIMSGVEFFNDENSEGRLNSLGYVPVSEGSIPVHQTDTSNIGPLAERYKDNNINIGLDASNLGSSHLESLPPTLTSNTESNLYTS